MKKYITSFTVRLEGEINTMWTFNYSDGSSDDYYAYEGSPQSSLDDRRVHDYDPKLALLLEILQKMTPPPEDEDGAVDVEYDSYCRITKITQQPAE